ncbi:MAG: ATP-binding protein, partial [Proteobacteria bacterium]|nr:ATP-binding protein [Pseudomonadota bacterium]
KEIEDLLKSLGGGGSMLVELKPGPLPMIPKKLWAEIEEWIQAWKHAEALRDAGLMAPGALLLYGPTGTGKTMLSKGVLRYMGGRPGVIMEAHNILTSGFGESGRNLAAGFREAEEKDALLVIEEIDALGISRYGNSGSCATEENKVTISLMRHLEDARIPVIATTNFRESLDPALLRRFEQQLEVPALDAKGRSLILKKILGRDAPEELVALPLTVSIRQAHRQRRLEFIADKEARA